MKVQVIKREIPTEISEAGGASVLIVNKETTDLETSIEESKDALIVVGDKLLVKGMFVGLFKSMITGIERDGNARSLGDFLTLYPVPTGEFDLEKGWDPAANGVRIRARLLNEMEIDISKWEFEDVTLGRQSFRLESVKAGDVTGVVVLGQAIEINGKPLPLTDEIRVDWAVRDTVKSGTIPATKVTSTVSRADIASDALDEIKSATYDGKTLDLTVRGNYANAKISAMLKYVAPPVPTLTNAHSPGYDPMEVSMTDDVILDGTNLKGFTRLVAHHEECADPIELPTLGCTATDDGTQLAMPGSIWNTIHAKVDPSVMPTRPITFDVITPYGTASISPMVP